MTLDLATRTGFAIGTPGAVPRSGSVRLKDREDEPKRAARNLGCFLRDQFAVDLPDVLVYEAAMPAGAMLNQGNASHTADFMWGLVGATEAICGPYGVRTVAANVQSVRKHFTGRARWGGRDDAKRAVIERCHVLGLMPRTCRDDNRADSLALFEWAASTLYRATPAALVLHGEVPA